MLLTKIAFVMNLVSSVPSLTSFCPWSAAPSALVALALSHSLPEMPPKRQLSRWTKPNWMDARFVSMNRVPREAVHPVEPEVLVEDLAHLEASMLLGLLMSNCMLAILPLILSKRTFVELSNSTERLSIAFYQLTVKPARSVALPLSPCQRRMLKRRALS